MSKHKFVINMGEYLNNSNLNITQRLANYLIQNDPKFCNHILQDLENQCERSKDTFLKNHQTRLKYLRFLKSTPLSLLQGPFELTPYDNYDVEKWSVHFDTNHLKVSPNYAKEYQTYNENQAFYISFTEEINSFLLILNKIFIIKDYLKDIYLSDSGPLAPQIPLASVPSVPLVLSGNGPLANDNGPLEVVRKNFL